MNINLDIESENVLRILVGNYKDKAKSFEESRIYEHNFYFYNGRYDD